MLCSTRTEVHVHIYIYIIGYRLHIKYIYIDNYQIRHEMLQKRIRGAVCAYTGKLVPDLLFFLSQCSFKHLMKLALPLPKLLLQPAHGDCLILHSPHFCFQLLRRKQLKQLSGCMYTSAVPCNLKGFRELQGPRITGGVLVRWEGPKRTLPQPTASKGILGQDYICS